MMNHFNYSLPIKSSIENQSTLSILILDTDHFQQWLKKQSDFVRNWIESQQFTAASQTHCQIPDPSGKLALILVGCESENDLFYIGLLAKNLPSHHYKLEFNTHFNSEKVEFIASLAFGMGAYEFKHYKSSNKTKKNTLIVSEQHLKNLLPHLQAIYFIRNIINAPTNDMKPSDLANISHQLAKTFNGKCVEIIGDDLLEKNYPAIHAVGRASINSPRLIDINWGNHDHPKITLVGKGVCFDSGGLDLKTASGMALMKKDMGGAAHVLGLAYLIMSFQLPIRLRVLIPAVENSVSGDAFRPGDVIKSRQGLNIEIGNTDAEGRLILCDALEEAQSDHPDLIIDIATLTGAAKVATGTDLPAYFTDDESLAEDLFKTGNELFDPLWRMPLYKPYRKLLDSNIADINNMGNSCYAGAITAALFLKEFVPNHISWVHFDIMAWNISPSPSHPEGGEAQGLRTLFEVIRSRFCARSSAG
jgi:leucyl aminopeptidase